MVSYFFREDNIPFYGTERLLLYILEDNSNEY